jgi:hypothetical protein
VTCDLRVTAGPSHSDRARSVVAIPCHRALLEIRGSLSGFCGGALGWAFHDQRQRDPPDGLSDCVLDIDGKVAPVPIRHFVLHNLRQGFLGPGFGCFKVVQIQPFTVGRASPSWMSKKKQGMGAPALANAIRQRRGTRSLFHKRLSRKPPMFPGRQPPEPSCRASR